MSSFPPRQATAVCQVAVFAPLVALYRFVAVVVVVSIAVRVAIGVWSAVSCGNDCV